MALISKANTFSAATTISSTQMNTNFDDLYNVLAGTNTTTQLKLVSSDGSTPLTLNQTSANYSQEWQDVGTTKLRVLKSGVVESIVSTGTAPLIVASTTKVTNLNADLLDGLSSASYVQVASGVITVAGAIPKFALNSDVNNDWSLRANTNNDLIFTDDTGAADVLFLSPSGTLRATGQMRADAAAPLVDSDLTRKDYVDTRVVPIVIGGFFPGTASTSAPRPSFIVPDGVVDLKVTKMKITYQGGTNSGTTTVRWFRNAVLQNIQDITTEAIGDLISKDIIDITLVTGDIIHFDISAAGSHADITVQVIGNMKVSS
jgi:hypothetical protein